MPLQGVAWLCPIVAVVFLAPCKSEEVVPVEPPPRPIIVFRLDGEGGGAQPDFPGRITTVLGMIPLLFDAFYVPMAVTIVGGLAVATILTMLVVPVFYAIFFKAKNNTIRP